MDPPGVPSAEARWATAWRIEVAPAERVRALRRFRTTTVIGSLAAGTVLLALLVGPFRIAWGGLPTVVPYLLVGYLFTLAPASWLALGWAVRRLPDRIAFDDTGLLVHLVGGQVFDVAWARPDLAIDLTNWGASDFSHGTVNLTARMKNGPPESPITLDGAGALRSEALGRGLGVETRVEGKGLRAFGLVELRAHPPTVGERAAARAELVAPEPDSAR